MLPATPEEAIREGLPGLRAELASQAGPLRADRRDRSSSGSSSSVRTAREDRAPHALRGVSGLISATNMKQRVRKLLEYTWADRLHYAVIGTPNLLEYDQGFFVKGGDGLADIKPIAGLYKSQVYAMARHLGLPERSPGARRRPRRSPAADAGGVLLRLPVRADGPAGVGRDERRARRRARAAGGLEPDAVEAAYWEIAAASATRRRTCTPGDRARCRGAGRLTCAASPASCARRATAGRGDRRCAAWPARCGIAGPTASAWRSDPGAGFVSTRSGDLRHPARLAADAGPGRGGTLIVYNGEVYNHPELRAELARDGVRPARPRATPRSCCGCSSATASPRSTS